MTTRGRLAIAALASLALHALVMAGAWMTVPEPLPPPLRLEARLVAEPPAARPAPAPAPTPRAREKRHPAPTPPAPVSSAPVETAPVPDAVATTATPEPEAPREATREPEAVATAAATEPPQRLALAAGSSAAVAAVRPLPRRGRIAFNLLYGADRYPVGKVVQTWEVEDGAYILASEAETSGIIDLFRPQRLRYMSQGRVMPEGLRPDSFLASRTRRGRNEAAQARFDWNAGELRYGSATAPKRAPLSPGAQDLMSLIYQFSLAPPAQGHHQLSITTGTRFEVYEIAVGPEESIDTPIGALKALPIKQIAREGSESIEFWLASEYRYLPVRIRHYDREGHFSGEQVVSEIRVSEEVPGRR